MPDVFTDEVGTYDLTITTSADWTVSSGGMPNGDNYVTGDGSIAATYNTNGDEFDFRDGTAWTVEFWLYLGATTSVLQTIMQNVGNGTSVPYCWIVQLGTDEKLVFAIGNTASGNYLSVISATTLGTGTWYYVVCVKETGNTVRLYLNTVQDNSNSSTTGTAQAPDGSYYLYLGSNGDGSFDVGASSSGLRISKLAIYNAQLTTDQMNDHYLAMVAS